MRFPVELIVAGAVLGSCAGVRERATVQQPPQRTPVDDRFVKVGSPYTIAGTTYRPVDHATLDELGYASWYGEELAGKRTANGEAFDPQAITIAHRTLPMPSYVEVTALDSGRTILARVNDRGPFHSNRIADLSLGAARQLGITGHGARPVRVRRVEPIEADKRLLQRGEAAALRRGPDAETLDQLRRQVGWRPPVALRGLMPSGAGPWFLQVATFTSEERARSLAERLGGQVAPAGRLFRVRLGPYESGDKAVAALAPLGARGYPDAVITR